MDPEPTANTTSARWIFVFNNPPVDWAPPQNASEVEYMCWQRERGEAGGTEHVQGYIRFKKRTRFNTAKRYFCVPEVHLEVARGNEQQNKAYCSKEETRVAGPWEFGVYKADAGTQGKRTDLDAIAADIKQGKSVKEVAEQHPSDYIRYHTGIEKFAQLFKPLPPVERAIKVVCLWGATGTGKTHRVRTQFPEAYGVTNGRDPWGNYNGQAVILFDEYDWTKWSIQDMNRYCDKWRCSLDCRYRDRYAEWTLVVICSNSEPYDWWPAENQLLRQAFWRRIVSIEVLSQQQEITIADVPAAANMVFSP